MAQLLRLILIALVLALAVPASGAHSAADAAIWSQTVTEAATHSDPPEGGRPCARPLPSLRTTGTLRRHSAITACRQDRSPIPEARGPPQP